MNTEVLERNDSLSLSVEITIEKALTFQIYKRKYLPNYFINISTYPVYEIVAEIEKEIYKESQIRDGVRKTIYTFLK